MIFRFKDRNDYKNFFHSIQHSDLFNNNSIEVMCYEEYNDKEEIVIYCIEVKGVK